MKKKKTNKVCEFNDRRTQLMLRIGLIFVNPNPRADEAKKQFVVLISSSLAFEMHINMHVYNVHTHTHTNVYAICFCVIRMKKRLS